jgi:hypothetical protein
MGAGPAQDLVFVSYSHEDRELLRRLLVLLDPVVRNRRLQVWADEYIPVGGDWRREIDAAVDRAALGLLLVSGDFLASRFIIEEELPALIEDKVPLAPVLVQDCLWEHEPLLASVQWAHDPGRDGPLDVESDRERNRRLVQVCRKVVALLPAMAGHPDVPPTAAGGRGAEPARAGRVEAGPVAGRLDGVPPLPQGYVARDEVAGLVAALSEGGSGAVGLTGDAGALGLHGQGGIGKTVLACALARDDRVRARFPDGVWWVTVGERADVVAAQLDLLVRLGVSGAAARSAAEGVRLLREALGERRALLVVDDVWSAAAAAAFCVVGPAGRVLYTSRDAAVLDAVGARVERVQVLSEAAAGQLAARVAGVPAVALPAAAGRVIAGTGRVALAVALAAAAVRGGKSWQEVAAELDRGAEIFGDHPYASTFKAMQVATGALDAELAAAYLSLAVFPADTRIPLAAVGRYWRRLRGSSAEQAARELAALAQAQLLLLGEDGGVTVSFHDLQHDYLLLHAGDLPVLHADLLAAYQQLLADEAGGWWQLPAEEPYIWDHLAHHLRGAGDRAGLLATVTDPAYLLARIAQGGPWSAEADLARAAAIAPADERVGWLREWVARHAHLLTGPAAAASDLAPTALAWQLAGPQAARAPGLDPSRLGRVLPARYPAVRWGLAATPPALIRVLPAHANAAVRAVAFSPDGALLASASHDGTVRLWNPRSGQHQASLTGHTDWVNAVAFSPDGALLASASADRTVRLWDPRSGQHQASLTGHTSLVNAVAFSPDSALLASASADGALWLWDPARRTPCARLRLNDPIKALHWGVDGIAVGSGRSVIVLDLLAKDARSDSRHPPS